MDEDLNPNIMSAAKGSLQTLPSSDILYLRLNRARHGFALEDAVQIFDGPTLEKVDDRFQYDEIRVYAIGLVNGVETTVIYTEVSDNGKSERYEKEAYRTNIC